MIKDSGVRREFESGAVRDMAGGKGRFDLMPLDVVAELYHSDIIDAIASFKEDGDVDDLYMALRLFCVSNYDSNMAKMMLEVSKHFERGAEKYGEYNWQKGIPCDSYIDSACRHYFKLEAGYDDEPHAEAFVWNLLCLAWTYEHYLDAHDIADKVVDSAEINLDDIELDDTFGDLDEALTEVN